MGELIFKTIQNNPAFSGLATMLPDIVYSVQHGQELKLQILTPQAPTRENADDTRYPCIVFVQGSAWTKPNVYYEIPQLSEFARKGYIVATVVHRSSLEGHKAPAFLEDVKTAIRFLRANAQKYRIDPERIGIWGTSSGGNTALLVGLTADDPCYKTEEYSEFSDKVCTVVECFGPADMPKLVEDFSRMMGASWEEGVMRLKGLLGDDLEEIRRRIHMMNPVEKIKEGVNYPPFLLIQGDSDPVVNYDQTELMAKALCDHDVHTEMIRVLGGEHEGNFWSPELLDMIGDYLSRTL